MTAGSPAHQTIAGRYCVEQTLGQGGMGVVYRVRDRSTGDVLALKLATLPEDKRRSTAASQFAHEYHTLAHLAHPRVVAVHDYGIEAGSPYYTMELLGGEDLRQTGKVAWKRACALLRDVCSALMLLHCRRIVHRDVTTRNIRVMPDGRGKLIDFGAMAPFGHDRGIVGTPPFMAPEVLRRQPLDGRTDLFALGAVGYWLLTGCHAYPAINLGSLEALWGMSVLSPSELEIESPPALDELVLALLNPDAQGRPASAAEVMFRLEAIGALQQEADLAVAQAYLTTPKIVGRDNERKRWLDVLGEAEGSACLSVVGVQGTGRSRVMDQVALDGKLAGRHVLQLDAAPLPRERFAAVGKLVAQLADLCEPGTDPAASPTATSRGDASAKLLTGVERLANDRPTLVVVDNLDQVDPASCASLVELTWLTSRLPLVVAVSYDPSRLGSAAQELVSELAARGPQLSLVGLELDQTLELLRSIFGEQSNLRVVAEWAQRVGRGRPRTTMELAQHLVDSGHARFELGHWVLAEDLSVLALPDSIELVLRSRINGLSPAARELAHTLAILAEVGIDLPPIGEYASLFLDALGSPEIFASLDELVGAGVLTRTEEHYVFESEGQAHAFVAALDETGARRAHTRIGTYFQAREGAHLRAAYHMWKAGREQQAFELLATPLPADLGLDSPHVRTARRPEGLALLHWSIDYMAARKPPADACALVYSEALTLAAALDPTLARCAPQALAQLVHDSGRDLFDEVDSTSPEQRLQDVLAASTVRWERTAPELRGLPPGQGIAKLSLAVAMLGGAYRRTLDVEGIRSLTVVEPFRAVPTIDIVQRLTEQAIHWTTGRTDVAALMNVLSLLDQPLPGLEEATRHGIVNVVTYRCGLLEALSGKEEALEKADHLCSQPVYPVLGWDIRAAFYRARCLDDELARAREQRGLAALRDSNSHLALGLPAAIATAAYLDDLMGLSGLISRAQADAERYSGWLPVHLYAQGCRKLMTGDLESALADFERACSLAPLGDHPYWLLPLEGRLRALLGIGASERAAALAETSEQAMRRRGLDPDHGELLQVAFALCEAASGRHQAGQGRLQHWLQARRAEGYRGLPIACLHEGLARIALAQDDPEEAAHHLHELATECGAAAPPGLAARCVRLRAAVDSLRGEAVRTPHDEPQAADADRPATAQDALHGWLASGALRDGLSRVAKRLAVPAAALFVHRDDGFELAEHHGGWQEAQVANVLTALADATLADDRERTMTMDDPQQYQYMAPIDLTTGSGERFQAVPLPMSECGAMLVVRGIGVGPRIAAQELVTILVDESDEE
ncbi:MAG: serine/threonine-protein kinase [Myxococcales bacterium]|nr:serine/threonine-protein kinase [Myxococcales bacterium]